MFLSAWEGIASFPSCYPHDQAGSLESGRKGEKCKVVPFESHRVTRKGTQEAVADFDAR